MIEFNCMSYHLTIILTIFSHHVIFERYLMYGVIALVDGVHDEQKMDQFSIYLSQVFYSDLIFLTKT